ncbi:zinc finger matrin-type protein 5 isoform X4 [Caretta caretta]|uniref:zinc finger matrin-type protein 5 isoform X4 n=1 Tax=Caretta caretta TaxID=8467 RepID=UPI003F4CA3BA
MTCSEMLLLSCWRSRARSPAGSFCKQCDFGFNCRFSHMTEEDLEKLNAQVQEERRPKEEGAEVPAGTVEDWLEKRAKRLSFAQSNSVEHGALAGIIWFPDREDIGFSVPPWLASNTGPSPIPSGTTPWRMASLTQPPVGMKAAGG